MKKKSRIFLKNSLNSAAPHLVKLRISLRGIKHFEANKVKNGAARLDLWEIFVLLHLKIPFHLFRSEN